MQESKFSWLFDVENKWKTRFFLLTLEVPDVPKSVGIRVPRDLFKAKAAMAMQRHLQFPWEVWDIKLMSLKVNQ